MENQINIGNQNSQQVGQNAVNQPIQNPEKAKLNYWMISAIVMIALFVGFLSWLLFGKLSKNNFLDQATQLPTPTTLVPKQSVTIRTLNLETKSINDLTTELFFAENNSLYKTKSDGVINSLTSLDENITNILFLPDKSDLVIITEKSVVLKEEYDEATNKMIPEVGTATTCWLFKEGTQKLELFPCIPNGSPLLYPSNIVEEMTRFERIFTKENDSGGAEIILDRLDGSQPTKIGFLKEKLLETACEFTNCTKEKYHPHLFVSSFNGSFLLNAHPRGGGLGEQGIVVSRDGSKIYKIDFYWYVSSAAWIDNNKLLTRDAKGSKLFIFNSDGTFETTIIPNDIGGQFRQSGLSPNKKLLALLSYNVGPNNDYEISLFDTTTFEKRSVELIRFGTVDPNAIRVVGWNKDSTKMLYVVGNEAKIYDLNSDKSNAIASLKEGAPEWVKVNKAAFAQNIFEIR